MLIVPTMNQSKFYFDEHSLFMLIDLLFSKMMDLQFINCI